MIHLDHPRPSSPYIDSASIYPPSDAQDDAATQGATVVTPMEVLSTHLMEVVKANLSSLLTLGAMQRQIEELKTLSDTARAERNRRYFDGMIPDKVSPETLLAVLRALLDEKVSIRNLPLIVDAMAEFRGIDSVEMIYELVRKRLRGQITQQYSDPAGGVSALQLHPAWEAEFVRADTETGRAGGGAVDLPSGSTKQPGLTVAVTRTDGHRSTGTMRNRLGSGRTPVDGYGLVDAEEATVGR